MTLIGVIAVAHAVDDPSATAIRLRRSIERELYTSFFTTHTFIIFYVQLKLKLHLHHRTVAYVAWLNCNSFFKKLLWGPSLSQPQQLVLRTLTD
ncbi:hypothetical protein ETB97_012175 [Aspergillus alliaceus]|uniref:Uncharacterized protein n=1 Tax=Petromyces alliaceus TaxID=209559 RepID=A0A8H6A6N6_PETAA|nr:hypothetical protein ETB97_012175 [Aspergillus burnettii]